ncbi:MAG: GTPase HflX [Verrucomicrobiae bacterium]|nr:GTPase HflX [Verrucomicrobiae bacterium]NNJ41743.1 GTPase HflX [Akkermansiaceae bacterium]
MFEVRDKPEMVERALLVRIYSDRREEEEEASLLAELGDLVTTLEIGVVDSAFVYTRSLHRKFLCGTGKAQEVVDLAKAHECDCIVFDNMFLPSQQRAWEELADMCVIDREEVILDIFSKRAHTKEARLQVDLAKMQYSLPRLTRMWGHLDREGGASGGGKGGGGASRGMGEQQVEVDRRLARTRIDQCKRELAEVRKQRSTRRKEREKQGIPCAAIAGYTNAGKSTLLNQLAQSEVMAKDMLFATLDTTTRSIELPNGQPLLLTDTVGFVRNLPHRLVEAFKATLEESVLADFIIHVVDASSPEVHTLYKTTMEVLAELGAGDKPVITVLNKMDVLDDPVKLAGLEVAFPNTIAVSAKSGLGMEELRVKCAEMLADRVQTETYRVPQSRGDLTGLLHREAKVLETEYDGNDVIIQAVVSPSVAGKLKPYAL